MIKNFLNQWFYKDKTNENDIEQQNIDNSIIFLIDSNNEPRIKIQISNIDSESSIQFGELLYSINNGYMQESILKVLLDISKQDIGANKFVQDSLSHWIYKNNQFIKSNNEPVINPTSFNQINHGQN